MSIDFSTDVGKVRLMIPDRDLTYAVFTDEEIEALITIEGDIRRAAALGLETIASDTAATLRTTETLGLKVDGTKASAELLKRAATLRTQALESESRGDPPFDIAEQAYEPFGTRELLYNELLRDAG